MPGRPALLFWIMIGHRPSVFEVRRPGEGAGGEGQNVSLDSHLSFSLSFSTG